MSAYDGLSAEAVGAACDIANHLAAVPMLREMLAIKDAALAAAKRENADLRAQNQLLRARMLIAAERIADAIGKGSR